MILLLTQSIMFVKQKDRCISQNTHCNTTQRSILYPIAATVSSSKVNFSVFHSESLYRNLFKVSTLHGVKTDCCGLKASIRMNLTKLCAWFSGHLQAFCDSFIDHIRSSGSSPISATSLLFEEDTLSMHF
jgi:hypothetical protein